MHSSQSHVGTDGSWTMTGRGTRVALRLRAARRSSQVRRAESHAPTEQLRAIDPSLAVRFASKKLIGRGGCSEVYMARDMASGARVALKVLSPTLSESASLDGSARMQREAELLLRLAALEHSVLPRLHARSENYSCDPWLALEYISGPTLAERIERGPIAVKSAIRWIADLADALDACHRIGIIHRDLKPANIILGTSIKLIDWGIAHDSAYNSRVTEIGMVAGTPRYMSPEQAQDHPTGPPTDVYSLGVVAYELLTGDAPFPGNSSVSIALRHMLEEPAPIVLPDSPAAAMFSNLVMSMLAKRAEDRPTMASVRDCCAAALAVVE